MAGTRAGVLNTHFIRHRGKANVAINYSVWGEEGRAGCARRSAGAQRDALWQRSLTRTL